MTCKVPVVYLDGYDPSVVRKSSFKPGQLVRLTNRSVFKLGVVIGESRMPGKVRVSSWSNAARSWSKPQAEGAEGLAKISLDDLSTRERGVLRRAQRTVEQRGEVAWSGGALTTRKVAP